VLQESVGILLRALYPIAPHITHALWNDSASPADGERDHRCPWPQPDPAALQQDEIELVVQVNGKLRASIRVPAAATRAIETAAINDATCRSSSPARLSNASLWCRQAGQRGV